MDLRDHCSAWGTRNITRKTSPHKHHYNKQATTQYDSPVSVELPQIMGSLNTHNMNTPHGTVLRTSFPRIRITLTVIERLEQVEILNLHLPRHATFVRCKLKHNNRNYMTAVMYQVTGLTCNFIYGMCLQPTGIIQLLTHITFYFSTCDPLTSSPQ